MNPPPEIAWKCARCGIQTTVPRELNVYCRCGYISVAPHTGPVVPPGILRQGVNYVKAWLRWHSRGCPVRTDERVAEVREICRTCQPWFDSELGICTHKKCGCKVAGGSWFGDKLRWKTEHCPVGKW